MTRKPSARSVSAKGRKAPAHPSIHIDIDPMVSAGFIHDRYDLLIQGRAVSPVPIEQIEVAVDGALIGRLEYGSMEGMPGGPADDSGLTQYAFYVNVPLPRVDAYRACACVITAKEQDGGSFAQQFVLSVDPDSERPVTVASGPTHPTSVYSHVRPPIVLYVERAALDDHGALLVIGWVISRYAMVAVQALIGEQKLDTAQLGGRRDDVANAFPAYTNARMSGFSLSTHIGMPTEGVSTVRVQAISRNGFSHEFVLPLERVRTLIVPGQPSAPAAANAPQAAPPPADTAPPTYQLATGFQLTSDVAAMLATPILVSPSFQQLAAERPAVRDPRRDIRYFCDDLSLTADGRLAAIGWAVCAIGISTITVYLDGKAMGRAELGLCARMSAENTATFPMARYSGFRVRPEQSAKWRPAITSCAWFSATASMMSSEEIRLIQIEGAAEEPSPAPPPPSNADTSVSRSTDPTWFPARS